MRDLIEAWSQWSSGKLSDSFVLWGLEMLWWGRIGKLLQATAILTVVVELIGAKRLTEFGNKLHGAFSFREARQLILDARNYLRLWNRYMRADIGSDDEVDALFDTIDVPASGLHDALSTILILAVAYLLWGVLNWWQYILALTTFIGFYAWISPYVTLIVAMTLSMIGMIFDITIIEPIAWIISLKKLDTLIKVLTLITAIAGIHFDFLAS